MQQMQDFNMLIVQRFYKFLPIQRISRAERNFRYSEFLMKIVI